MYGARLLPCKCPLTRLCSCISSAPCLMSIKSWETVTEECNGVLWAVSRRLFKKEREKKPLDLLIVSSVTEHPLCFCRVVHLVIKVGCGGGIDNWKLNCFEVICISHWRGKGCLWMAPLLDHFHIGLIQEIKRCRGQKWECWTQKSAVKLPSKGRQEQPFQQFEF